MKITYQQNGFAVYEGTPKELSEYTRHMQELVNKKEEKTIIMDLSRLSNKKMRNFKGDQNERI